MAKSMQGTDISTGALPKRLERVAEEAEELFAREGFLHFSTTEIAQRLRCSKTTLYSIAPTRMKFFEVIALRRLNRLNQDWIDAEAQAPDCMAAIRAFTEACINSVGVYGDRFIKDLQSFPGGLRALKRTEAQRLRIFESVLVEGTKAGAFRKFDPELTAIAWTAAVNKVIEPEFLSNSSFTVSQALRQLHKLFSQGLFVRESESARVVGRPAARSRARNRASASVFALNA